MNSLLKIDNVTLMFPMIEKKILENISYDVTEGDFVIVLGGNGSGKSSLLKLIDKRYKTTSGAIYYRGIEINKTPMQAYYQSVKTLTQSTVESLFPSLTVMENYKLFVGANHKPRDSLFKNNRIFADYLAQFNTQLAIKLDQQVLYLSGGEKQALVLALIMMAPPDLLLLDEHTSALDPKSADNIIQLTGELVKKHRITCLLATHDLQLASTYGDRLLSLKDGKVYRTLEKPQKSSLTAQDLRSLCY